MSGLSTSPYHLFNRRLLLLRQRRFSSTPPHFLDHEVRDVLKERLMGVKRSFKTILILGRAGALYQPIFPEANLLVGEDCLLMDDELLPFAPQTFDLILSPLSWHWVNDLPGTLAQVRTLLKPDGLLIAAFFGGNSLWQLRSSLQEAEDILLNGVSARVVPMIAPHDGAALLQRAGFALPVADHDQITLHYPSLKDLLKDLRRYGQTNVLYNQPKTVSPRDLFSLTEHIYREKFGREGQLPVTVNVIYLTGWCPHPSQPQPLLPGSGQIKMNQLFSN